MSLSFGEEVPEEGPAQSMEKRNIPARRNHSKYIMLM